MSTSEINIVFASDNYYVQHLATALCSLFENTTHGEDIIINIIDGGISKENKEYLEGLIGEYGSQLHIKKINKALLNDVMVSGHITEATYYRILIPSLFKGSITKVIYLDCDIIIRNDIKEFWSNDIEGYALGAIRLYEYQGHQLLGIPESSSYFNAGILLMNLQKWREANISKKVLHFIVSYPERLRSWDQDALNGVLYNDWIEIELEWNLRSQLFKYDYQTAGLDTEENFIKLKNNPKIVHFTTASKPWHYINRHPFKGEYFYYLNKSGFEYENFPEKKIIDFKRLVLFGASEKAKELTKDLTKLGLKISFYVDNDSEKWGKYINGVMIKSPETVLENSAGTVVIIASQYINEIKAQLLQMGLVENQSFVVNIVQLSYLK